MEQVTTYALAFFKDLLQILGEMSPYLLLGFFFAGLLHAFVPQKHINKYLGGKSIKASFNASLFGVPLPLCSCGVIPTGLSMHKNGASKGSTVSFLTSTPQTGIDSIFVTYSMLGLPFAIIRPIIAFVTGVLGGFLTNQMDDSAPSNIIEKTSTNTATKSFSEKVKDVFQYGFVIFLQDISKWLIIGLVLAAIISVAIPDSFFANQDLPLFAQMLIILVFSIPLYICATASVPLAAVLMMKGISPGAALVLLMAGPATNAATITMIGKVLGRKTLWSYLISIIGGALIFGFIIDTFLPVEWFTLPMNIHSNHNHVHFLGWLEIISSILLVGLIINGYLQQNTSKTDSNIMATETIKVDGMTCNHCKANVENNLSKLSFIDKAVVNLEEKTVALEGKDIDLDTVRKTVDDLGYKNL